MSAILGKYLYVLSLSARQKEKEQKRLLGSYSYGIQQHRNSFTDLMPMTSGSSICYNLLVSKIYGSMLLKHLRMRFSSFPIRSAGSPISYEGYRRSAIMQWNPSDCLSPTTRLSHPKIRYWLYMLSLGVYHAKAT